MHFLLDTVRSIYLVLTSRTTLFLGTHREQKHQLAYFHTHSGQISTIFVVLQISTNDYSHYLSKGNLIYLCSLGVVLEATYLLFVEFVRVVEIFNAMVFAEGEGRLESALAADDDGVGVSFSTTVDGR